MDLKGKHGQEYLLELLTQAHMKGQRNVGRDSTSYSNARSDCLRLLREIEEECSYEKWNKFLPDKPGYYWVLTVDGKEHPAKYEELDNGVQAKWVYDHKYITNEVIAYKKCPGSHCKEVIDVK